MEDNILDSGFEEYTPSPTAELKEEVNGGVQLPEKQDESFERALNRDFNLAQFVANEIGAEDGKIVTGSLDNPLEYDIDSLGVKQQIALLKNHYANSSKPAGDFSEDEMSIISRLREGKVQDVYSQLAGELDIPTSTPQYNDEQLIAWKLKSDFPNMTDEELIQEVEAAKESSTYEKKIEQIRNQYTQAVEQYQQTQQEEAFKAQQGNFIEAARNTNELFGFEINDDVKNRALSDIFEKDGNNQSRLLSFLDTPEGMVNTAMLWNALPEINEYVNSLHEQIDQLKAVKEEPKKTAIYAADTKAKKSWLDNFPKLPELKTIE